MNNNGILVVISAPSGCGKDTVAKLVTERLGENAFISVSMTTRQMRPGDVEGVTYYFVSEDEFRRSIESGELLEHAVYGKNFYGTPIAPVKKLLVEGKIVFLVIEVEGGKNVKNIFPEALKIFIVPPSLKVLEERLRGRGTDSEDSIKARMAIAKCELERADEYDYIVENDDLHEAVNDVLAIIRAEQLRINNMQNKLREVVKDA